MLLWSNSPSLSVGFFIQDEAVDVARSAPHGDVIFLLSQLRMKKGARGSWYSELGLHQHSIYPGGQHTLAVYTKCVTPVGLRM